ncbi:MAG: cobalt-precorrin-5B (C(1))-methyltransferase CbiD [Deltaproteobacteria bacterium]
MGKEFGYTTGTYAAAAAKAALVALLGERDVSQVGVRLPMSGEAKIPVSRVERSGDYVKCGVVKKSVEENDVTDKIEIFARVSLRKDSQIVIDGGIGIGRITKKGLQLPVGEAAINPGPRRMIRDSVRELTSRGVDVVISAPLGEEVAIATTNSRLGIIGGISIIGTTGIMRAKSSVSFKETILRQLDFCRENGLREIVITPGNISEEAMLAHFGDRVCKERIVQSGDFLGFTLSRAHGLGLGFVLAGHPGKLAKVLGGYFQTHHTKSPPANDSVIRLLEKSVSKELVKEMKESPTVEGIAVILEEHGKTELLNNVADAIEERVRKYLKADFSVPVLLIGMDKRLMGFSRTGAKWARG